MESTPRRNLLEKGATFGSGWGRAIATDYDGFPIFCRHSGIPVCQSCFIHSASRSLLYSAHVRFVSQVLSRHRNLAMELIEGRNRAARVMSTVRVPLMFAYDKYIPLAEGGAGGCGKECEKGGGVRASGRPCIRPSIRLLSVRMSH